MCDYACHFFQDCCIDRANNDTCLEAKEAAEFRQAVAHLEQSQFQCLKLPFVREEYFYVSVCPDAWADANIREKCEDPTNSDLNAASIPLSAANYVTYRNLYCAICNGGDPGSMEPWELDLLCIDEVRSAYLSGNITYQEMIARCSRVSIVGRTLTVRQCFQGDDFRCAPETCPELSVPCGSFKASFVEPWTANFWRNTFCYYCSLAQCVSPDLSGEDESMFSREFGSCLLPITGKIAIRGLQPISLLFDFGSSGGVRSVVSSESVQQTSVTCAEGEVFDPFEEQCMLLHCADGFILHDGRCVRSLESIPFNSSCGAVGAADIGVRVSLSNNVTLSSDASISKALTVDCLKEMVFTNLSVNLYPIDTNDVASFNTTFLFISSNLSIPDSLLLERLEEVFADATQRNNLMVDCGIETLEFIEGCLNSIDRSCLAADNDIVLLLLSGGRAASSKEACALVSIFSHYLWLSVFTITTALAIDLARTFGNREAFTLITNSNKVFIVYLGGALGVAAVIVVVCVGLAYRNDMEQLVYYGDDSSCWIGNGIVNLIAFGCPVAVALLLNMCLFAYTVCGLRKRRQDGRRVRKEQDRIDSFTELRIYVKISTLMGFTWILGFVAAFAGVGVLWYIFIILNSLQGVYIMIAFIFNKRIYELWKGFFTRGRATSSEKSEQLPMSSNMSKTTVSTGVS
ncbi:uncharacterized protein [Diadema antillarum]|uniref:uncharacterized protein n=1 Tax=Diadema antillarum TaxID=105358 RepID=UPI003A861DB2